MSADLQSTSAFARVSLLLMDDCLIQLEHGRTEDRMRKAMFDSIRQVVIWHTIPWVRIAFSAIFFLLPGVGLLFFENIPGTVFGVALLLVAAFLIVKYSYYQITTIRIVRTDKTHDVTGIFRPGKFEKFRTRFLTGIRLVQQQSLPVTPPRPSQNDVVPSEFPNAAADGDVRSDGAGG